MYTLGQKLLNWLIFCIIFILCNNNNNNNNNNTIIYKATINSQLV